ncbi:hypothetical protein E6H18_10815 [Candidatus Bathyarchaeota archaeon]|nr:MAG: hypothetical protein E6H18_10815 [Candidatus Bathyarchaeota archaeon]
MLEHNFLLAEALSMSQTQTRKQKILGDVKRKRRQRAITSIAIAVILIAIVVAAVIFLRPPPNAVQLPDYLSHCVIGSGLYHSHPNLTITINGANVPVPANTFDSSCQQPIHTHDEPGVLHIETDQDRDYTLHDWFLLWGHHVNNTNYAIFNSNQIFTNKIDATHHLTMTKNGVNDNSFENHVFPRNASPTGGVGGQGTLCAVATGQPCVEDNIVITYG